MTIPLLPQNKGTPPPATIDAYIAAFPPEIQALLRQVRATIRQAAPQAAECISYRMPAFRQGGILVYFAAFKHHIGLYPPVRGDAALEAAAAPYAGAKGNLRLPYSAPLPLDLIAQIVAFRLAQHQQKATPRPKRAR